MSLFSHYKVWLAVEQNRTEFDLKAIFVVQFADGNKQIAPG